MAVIELTVDEGRVYGSRYYTVKPEFDYWYGTEPEHWSQMVSWMVETFGPTPKDGVWTPNAQWYVNNSKFWFRNKKDLEWFILKWQ